MRRKLKEDMEKIILYMFKLLQGLKNNFINCELGSIRNPSWFHLLQEIFHKSEVLAQMVAL